MENSFLYKSSGTHYKIYIWYEFDKTINYGLIKIYFLGCSSSGSVCHRYGGGTGTWGKEGCIRREGNAGRRCRKRQERPRIRRISITLICSTIYIQQLQFAVRVLPVRLFLLPLPLLQFSLLRSLRRDDARSRHRTDHGNLGKFCSNYVHSLNL